MGEEPMFAKLGHHCLFCDPGKHEQAHQILLRSDNFYLFAGLGAIVEGYIIITPYRCDDASQRIRSLSEVPYKWMDELAYLRLIVAGFYRDVYKTETLTFEHGRAGSCMVSESETQHCYHGHLCCYPFAPIIPMDAKFSSKEAYEQGDVPLWEEIEGYVSEPISDVHELPAKVGSNPYLFLEGVIVDPVKNPGSALRERWQHRVVCLGNDVKLERQYLRRLLANRINEEHLWDWRRYPMIKSVESVRSKFSNYLRANEEKLHVRWLQDGPVLSFTESVEASNVMGNNAVAEEYDKLWGNRLQHEALGQFIKHLNNVPINGSKYRSVLDGGCGPGNYTKVFYYHGFECVGIDRSSEMCEIALRMVKGLRDLPEVANPPPRPQISDQNAADPMFPSNSFHGIWYSAIVVHIPRIELLGVLRKLYEILKPEGVIYLSAQLDGGTNQRVTMRREGRIFFYYSIPELKEMFTAAGFEILREWQDTANVGSRGDTNTKVWRQFILRKGVVRELDVAEIPAALRLRDLGEAEIHRRILNRLPKEAGHHVNLMPGDDCAAIAVPENEMLVVSTDPCPLPVLSMFEGNDYRCFGWFSMVIGLSDLAAMGARPLGMLLALEAEELMPVASLDAFYDGVLDASQEFNCPILGGNVKDARQFNCVGTVLGSVKKNRMLRRSSARVGQRLFVLGDMGLFWAGVLCLQEGIWQNEESLGRILEPLRRPMPRIREGEALIDQELSECAMDSSDGLTACFASIAEQSQVDLNIDIEKLIPLPEVTEVAKLTGIDARKMMLGWGDWQLVCTVSNDKAPLLYRSMEVLNCSVADVGWVSEGNGQVWVQNNSGRLGKLTDFASTRFSNASYFSHGINTYIQKLRNQPLFLKEG